MKHLDDTMASNVKDGDDTTVKIIHEPEKITEITFPKHRKHEGPKVAHLYSKTK